jgi:hypothetical protein
MMAWIVNSVEVGDGLVTHHRHGPYAIRPEPGDVISQNVILKIQIQNSVGVADSVFGAAHEVLISLNF